MSIALLERWDLVSRKNFMATVVLVLNFSYKHLSFRIEIFL
jgi:hypothetical protein